MYLVYIVESNDAIECAIKIVQEVDHLHRTTLGTQCCETNDVAEVDCDAFKLLGLHHLTGQ